MSALAEFSSNSNPKRPVIVALSNSSGIVWTQSILIRPKDFQPQKGGCGALELELLRGETRTSSGRKTFDAFPLQELC